MSRFCVYCGIKILSKVHYGTYEGNYAHILCGYQKKEVKVYELYREGLKAGHENTSQQKGGRKMSTTLVVIDSVGYAIPDDKLDAVKAIVDAVSVGMQGMGSADAESGD
jgi:hypothetical protein